MYNELLEEQTLLKSGEDIPPMSIKTREMVLRNTHSFPINIHRHPFYSSFSLILFTSLILSHLLSKCVSDANADTLAVTFILAASPTPVHLHTTLEHPQIHGYVCMQKRA
jgi:hypothetical protein